MTSRAILIDFEETLELIPTSSADPDSFDTARNDANDGNDTPLLTNEFVFANQKSKRSSLPQIVPRQLRHWFLLHRHHHPSLKSRSCSSCRRPLLRRFIAFSYGFLALILVLIVVGGTFFPSYSHPPEHYSELRYRVAGSKTPGIGNIGNSKVFIAASLYDPGGKLAGGPWADNLLRLIDLLGPRNTYLSIYENDSGPEGKDA